MSGDHECIEDEEEVTVVVGRDERGRFARRTIGVSGPPPPSANTIEALRGAIEASKRAVAQADGDIAALVAGGIRTPTSLTSHRAYHLMRLRAYIDRLYTALNHGIAGGHGMPMDEITPDHLP